MFPVNSAERAPAARGIRRKIIKILVIIILITYILKKGKKCTLNVLEMI